MEQTGPGSLGKVGNVVGMQEAPLADVVAFALDNQGAGVGTGALAATGEGTAYRAWIGCLIFSVGVTGSAIGLNLQKYAIRNQRRSRKQSSSSNNDSGPEGTALESNYSSTPSKLASDGSQLGNAASSPSMLRFELSWLAALAPTEAEVAALDFGGFTCSSSMLLFDHPS